MSQKQPKKSKSQAEFERKKENWEAVRKKLSNKPVFKEAYNPLISEKSVVTSRMMIAGLSSRINGLKILRGNDRDEGRKEKEAKGEVGGEPPKETGEDQILQVIEKRENMSGYIPFTWEEFIDLYSYSKYRYVFNYDTRWGQRTTTRVKTEKYASKIGIKRKFLFFFYVYYLHMYCSQKMCYEVLHLERFNHGKEEGRGKTSEQSFVSDILRKAINEFAVALYNNLIDIRRIETSKKISIGSMKSPEFNFIIPELEHAYSIVDGRNQEIPKQTIDKQKNITDTAYYNHKTNGNGIKTMVRVESLGYATFVSDSYPAAVHDSNVYYMELNTQEVPEGTFELADGGYRGIPRVITPYPICSENVAKGTFVSDNGIELHMSFIAKINGDEVVFNEIIIGSIYGEMKDKGRSFEGTIVGTTTKSLFMNIDKPQYIEVKCIGDCCIDESKIEANDPNFICVNNISFDGYLCDDDESYDITGTIDGDVYGMNGDLECMKLYNITFASCRILVENFFGRQNTLFAISRRLFNLSLGIYNMINKSAAAITNYHIHLKPLREFPFFLFCKECKSFNVSERMIKSMTLPESAKNILKELTHCKDINTIQDIIGEYNETRGRRSNANALFHFVRDINCNGKTMSNDPFDYIKRNIKEYNSTTVFNLKEIVTNEVKETEVQQVRKRKTTEMKSDKQETKMIEEKKGDNDDNSDILNYDVMDRKKNSKDDAVKRIEGVWLSSDMLDCWKLVNDLNINPRIRMLDGGIYPQLKEAINNGKFDDSQQEIMKDKLLGKKREMKYIVIPCNHDNKHWNLLMWYVAAKELYFIDSFNDKTYVPVEMINFITSINNTKVIEVKTDIQTDGWSCGYRMLYYMSHFLFSQRVTKPTREVKLDEKDYNHFLGKISVIIEKYRSAEAINKFGSEDNQQKQVFQIFSEMIKKENSNK